MKASKILAGLSAVSIAASMLSMVGASADETEKLTVDEGVAADTFDFDDGDDFVDTEGVEDAEEETTVASADYGKKFSSYKWYPSFTPKTATLGFAGWPGWGLSEFPDGWAWALGIKTTKDLYWETFGTKDLDKAAPGYLVFEFDNGKKWLVPAAVDENGTFVTDEVSIPYSGVSKIYFLYEISEAPYFSLELDKFTVNGKDVELNKDNWKNDVKYVKTTGGADDVAFLLDVSNNVPAANQIVDENGNVVAIEESPIYYQATIYSKDNQADSVINHALVLWGTKVTVTFKVDGIGKTPVHGKATLDGPGDDKGEIHTHVDPDEAGGLGVQKQNLNYKTVNPKFFPSSTCSKDLYDQLVEVYNSDPDHKADAEIRFKTVSDKGGVLVANFINVWEIDNDRDGTTRHWIKEFRRTEVKDANGNVVGVIPEGYAVYVKQEDVVVDYEKQTVKCYKLLGGAPILKYDTNGNPVGYEEEDMEVTFDGKTKYWPVNKEGVPEEKTAEKKELKEKHWIFDNAIFYDELTGTYKKDPRFGKPVAKNEIDAIYSEPPLKKDDLLEDDKQEEAYCWHAYFLTENGLVDTITKNYMGDYKTNAYEYKNLTESQIKYLADNNGMYYNDDIHHAAYGHFVVFGDNTEREYSYRIKAEAIKSILDSVQRSVVQRNTYIYRHGAVDIVAWHISSDGVVFNEYNKLIAPDDEREDGFTKDYESTHWIDSQVAMLNSEGKYTEDGANKDNIYKGPDHARATHGAVWLQCCEGTYIKDVKVHATTDILRQGQIPTLYVKDAAEDDFSKMYPTKSVETSSAAPAAPTATEAPADENAGSGAAAGFGIAGLLLAGAAMVCAKKKDR